MDLGPDPFVAFEAWYNVARRTEPDVPEAMQLATCVDGRPSVRTVLLKAYGPNGFQFFTNRRSQKGRELEANPYAAAVFHWKSQQQQVRIEGRVIEESEAVSDEYFASRDRGSQIGAWASDQSATLPDSVTLSREVTRVTREFEGNPVPRPPWWGGFRILPDRIELWQGRPSRLHDRVLWSRDADEWRISLLSP